MSLCVHVTGLPLKDSYFEMVNAWILSDNHQKAKADLHNLINRVIEQKSNKQHFSGGNPGAYSDCSCLISPFFPWSATKTPPAPAPAPSSPPAPAHSACRVSEFALGEVCTGKRGVEGAWHVDRRLWSLWGLQPFFFHLINTVLTLWSDPQWRNNCIWGSVEVHGGALVPSSLLTSSRWSCYRCMFAGAAATWVETQWTHWK